MNQYEFVTDLKELQNTTSDKIGFLTYKKEPPKKLEGRSPALDELVATSLEKLDARKKPFFFSLRGRKSTGEDMQTKWTIWFLNLKNLTRPLKKS